MKSALALELIGVITIFAGVMVASFGADSKVDHTKMLTSGVLLILIGCGLGFIGARQRKRLKR
jgi:uncharacterized membrane protein YidH (DUF202 family)